MKVWHSFSFIGKTRPVFAGGNPFAETYSIKIKFCSSWQSQIASLGEHYSIPQDIDVHLSIAMFSSDYIYSLLGDLTSKLVSTCGISLECAVKARMTGTITSADLQQRLVEEWVAIPQKGLTKPVSRTRRSSVQFSHTQLRQLLFVNRKVLFLQTLIF